MNILLMGLENNMGMTWPHLFHNIFTSMSHSSHYFHNIFALHNMPGQGSRWLRGHAGGKKRWQGPCLKTKGPNRPWPRPSAPCLWPGPTATWLPWLGISFLHFCEQNCMLVRNLATNQQVDNQLTDAAN